ncbi:hypothetical protein [Gordonia bronchialis]|uniref:hypothetical protein n=1 Tax=Gordonia bronchialis TaxID=2054 RepID=UPI00242C57AB|nr:hypothetical protein [Gordonia bronchialis]
MSPSRRPSSRLITTLAPAIAAIVLVAGCGDSADDGAASSSADAGCATENTSGREGVNLIPIPPAKVTVTGHGTEPRRAPAAAPDLAAAQRATVVTTSTVASRGTTEAQTVDLSMTARFACTDPTDLEMDLGTTTSPDPALDGQLAAIDGSRAGMAIAPGLAPISLRLMPDDDAGPEARLAVEQALIGALTRSVPMPTEPVGVGATWRVQRVVSAAATVTQTIEARITAWTGNRVTITYTADETPVNSVFAIPGGNQTLTIARYSFTGSGTVIMDLTRGLPVGGEATYRGARELVGADASRPLLQQTGFTLSWR